MNLENIHIFTLKFFAYLEDMFMTFWSALTNRSPGDQKLILFLNQNIILEISKRVYSSL